MALGGKTIVGTAAGALIDGSYAAIVVAMLVHGAVGGLVSQLVRAAEAEERALGVRRVAGGCAGACRHGTQQEQCASAKQQGVQTERSHRKMRWEVKN